MENKLFKANPDKKLFTITIIVSENIAKLLVEPHNSREVNYHEIVGALETQKMHLVSLQRERNMKDQEKSKRIKAKP